MVSRTFYSFIVLLLCYSFVQAQKTSFQFSENQSFRTSSHDAKYTDYKIYSADISELQKSLKGQNANLELVFGDMPSIQTDLSPSYIVAENFIMSSITLDGIELSEVSVGPSTFKGYTSYGPVRLTINEDYIGGFISFDGNKLFIEQISTSNGKTYFALVKEEDFLNPIQSSCAHISEVDGKEQKTNEQRVTGNCYRLDMAIAADYSMYAKHGTVEDVANHIVNTMNIVASNYELNGSINFDDGAEFNITEIMVSTCIECDEWTDDVDIFAVLSDFSSWASSGGFSTSHNIGQFWTDRDYTGNYVGLANLATNLFCGNGAYHVLQDYTTSSAFLSTMTAHEIGHNFGGNHASTAGFIMSPSLSNTDTWSSTSQLDISATIASQGPSCLGSCGINLCSATEDLVVSNITTTDFDVSWQADFGATFNITLTDLYSDQVIYQQSTTGSSLHIADSDYKICKKYLIEIQKICGANTSQISSIIFHSAMSQGCADFVPEMNVNWANSPMNFTDMSMYATAWDWDFGDGTTSIMQNPTHTYTTPGIYMVKLMVNNGAHYMEVDSTVSVLPDRAVPYGLSDGGSFDVSTSDFAAQGLSGTTSIWELGIATGPLSSSDNVWKTKLSEDVGQMYSESALYSPRFDFSVTTNYLLEFQQSMEAIYCNGPYALRLEYSIDNGSSWTRLGSYGDGGSTANSWYNRGPTAACPISASLFSDQTGWTYNASNVYSSYDVSFLSGNQQVIFRFVFSVSGSFSGGYDGDGSMINDFRISSSGGVVALDLLNLEGSATSEYNQLKWEVANMENFDTFRVQKSTNGQNFVEIGLVKGDEQNLKYCFKDSDIGSSITYYRLQMLDDDGSFNYSDVIKIENWQTASNIKIYPNPILEGELTIDTDIEFDKVQVMMMDGKIVLESAYSEKIAMDNLPPGIYLLALRQNQNIVYQQKLLKL